jgi:uncharacterized membrane protein YjjP (DUF1212 family)
VSELFREGKNWGCGAAVGLVMGLFLAMDLTRHWVRPSVWYEWPVVFAVVVSSAIVAGWAVGKWGNAAVAILVSVFSWCG